MSNVQVNSQWRSVEQKFYRKDWPLTKLLEARNGGLITDEGEAWIYVFSHKDGTGGEYDLLRRRVPAPAVPDDVAGLIDRLRAAYNRHNHVRTTWLCVGEAAATIEAQAAELARYREALQPFASAWRIAQASGLTSMVQLGTLARNEVYAVAFMKAAALTQPTGDRT